MGGENKQVLCEYLRTKSGVDNPKYLVILFEKMFILKDGMSIQIKTKLDV
jgi:hypothetical protein